jgi:hypothetical protein
VPTTSGQPQEVLPSVDTTRVAGAWMAGQDFGNLSREVLKIAEAGLSKLEED